MQVLKVKRGFLTFFLFLMTSGEPETFTNKDELRSLIICNTYCSSRIAFKVPIVFLDADCVYFLQQVSNYQSRLPPPKTSRRFQRKWNGMKYRKMTFTGYLLKLGLRSISSQYLIGFLPENSWQANPTFIWENQTHACYRFY